MAVRFFLVRLLGRLSRRQVAPAAIYGSALVAERLAGGGGDWPLIAIAAPVAAGVLIRLSRKLDPADILRLVSAHAIVAMLFQDPLPVFAREVVCGVSAVASAVVMFAALRSRGFVSSQAKAASAAAIAGLLAASVAAAIAAAAFDASGAEVTTLWTSLALGFGLTLPIALAHGRSEVVRSGAGEEISRSRSEGVTAGVLLAAVLIMAAATGRPEATLAASAALAWFALRLGLYPTSLAALSYGVALATLSANGVWAGPFDGSDGSAPLLHLVIAAIAGPSLFVAASVGDHKRAAGHYAYRAMHDGLTGLANRALFLETLDTLSDAARRGDRRFALLLIDLDFFKRVNDTFGHARGDALLREVANRLRSSIRSTDLVARIGGDEFAVLAPVRTVEDARSVARRLVETVNEAFDLDGVHYAPSITVGGVLAPDSASEPERLMLLADEALYLAKAAGRNCWRFKVPEDEPGDCPAWAMGEGTVRTETVFLD